MLVETGRAESFVVYLFHLGLGRFARESCLRHSAGVESLSPFSLLTARRLWIFFVCCGIDADMSSSAQATKPSNVHYEQYDSSKEAVYLSAIRQLISKDLSEPYSIYVYRYFLYQWGDLCFMVRTSFLRISFYLLLIIKQRHWMSKKIFLELSSRSSRSTGAATSEVT